MTIDKPNTVYFPSIKAWILQEDYYNTIAKVRIPSGFKYDGASVPRILWAIINPLDLSEAAPLVHDYLYRLAGQPVREWIDAEHPGDERYYPKKYADTLFRDIMKQWKVDEWKESAAYHAVDSFAGFAWRKHLKDNRR